MTMKRYIKNLVLAICGRNPFAEEVENLKEKLEKAGENTRGLQNQLYAALEKQDAERDKQIASLQALVENLRDRIKEKDAEQDEQGREYRQRMEQTHQMYDKRIATYAKEIERLQEQLKQ